MKGMAHITGGGLTDNIPRCLPQGTAVVLDTGRWTRQPHLFDLLQEWGNIGEAEMRRTFNCGLGMVLVVPGEQAEAVAAAAAELGERAAVVGQVVAGRARCCTDDGRRPERGAGVFVCRRGRGGDGRGSGARLGGRPGAGADCPAGAGLGCRSEARVGACPGPAPAEAPALAVLASGRGTTSWPLPRPCAGAICPCGWRWC